MLAPVPATPVLSSPVRSKERIQGEDPRRGSKLYQSSRTFPAARYRDGCAEFQGEAAKGPAGVSCYPFLPLLDKLIPFRAQPENQPQLSSLSASTLPLALPHPDLLQLEHPSPSLYHVDIPEFPSPGIIPPRPC